MRPGMLLPCPPPPPNRNEGKLSADLERGMQDLVRSQLAELSPLLQALCDAVQVPNAQQASASFAAVQNATHNVLRVIASGEKASSGLFDLKRTAEFVRNCLYTVTNTMSRGSQFAIAEMALQNKDMVAAVVELCPELKALVSNPPIHSNDSFDDGWGLSPNNGRKSRSEVALQKLTRAYAAELPAALSTLATAITARDQKLSSTRFTRAKNRSLNVIRALETAEKANAGQYDLLQAVKVVRDGLYTLTNAMSRAKGEPISAAALGNDATVKAAGATLASLEAKLNYELTRARNQRDGGLAPFDD